MLGVIGGSGLYELAALRASETASEKTPYGDASQAPVVGRLGGADGPWTAFLPRHGRTHALAPHQINYRANLWALAQAGVSAIVAVNSVGSLRRDWTAGTVVIPEQLIDYTSGREGTFTAPGEPPRHVDFTEPFDPDLRRRLAAAADAVGVNVAAAGTYGCTQGPRYETAAEIRRMDRDGCDLVGMTAMPECILSRELDIPYSVVCSVGNLAAGLAGPHQMLDHHEIIEASAASIGSITAMIERLELGEGDQSGVR